MYGSDLCRGVLSCRLEHLARESGWLLSASLGAPQVKLGPLGAFAIGRPHVAGRRTGKCECGCSQTAGEVAGSPPLTWGAGSTPCALV